MGFLMNRSCSSRTFFQRGTWLPTWQHKRAAKRLASGDAGLPESSVSLGRLRENARLGVGGIDYGLLFGGSKTVLHGRVRNIQRASDVAGVYAAAGAGLAVGGGVRAIVLTNQNGGILELSGRQVGLMANADLSGLAITMEIVGRGAEVSSRSRYQ